LSLENEEIKVQDSFEDAIKEVDSWINDSCVKSQTEEEVKDEN
jgi:hypothetical protein